MEANETALAVQPGRSLAEVVDDTQAWFETVESIDDPEQRAEAERGLVAAIEVEVRKVDGVAEYLLRCSAEEDYLKGMAERFQERAQGWRNRADRLKVYAARVLQSLPGPKRGARKLEGKLHTLSLRAGSSSVLIESEERVPLQYKVATVQIPAESWNCIGAVLLEQGAEELIPPISDQSFGVRKAEIHAALKAGAEVPGADLVLGEPTVQVR